LISLEELAAERRAWDEAGARVAFVPTMGALHDGHASLVRQARAAADRVLVSIFVNPTQFGPKEDFSRYPRTLAADMMVLEAAGADAVFVPNAATIYPEGFQTYVHNKKMAQELDGISRPGHFEGVLTVVLKLLLATRPHVAIFGKKDY
jgi:pantoate--beta-alanine ligase